VYRRNLRRAQHASATALLSPRARRRCPRLSWTTPRTR